MNIGKCFLCSATEQKKYREPLFIIVGLCFLGAEMIAFLRNSRPAIRYNLFLFKEKRKRIFTAIGAKNYILFFRGSEIILGLIKRKF